MNESPSLHASTVESLSARVEERVVGPCRVLMLKTPVQAVVSWRGSFLAYPDMAAGERLVQGLAVQLLDKGTRLRDRFALAEALENRGAQLQFTSEALRVVFQGRALRDDVTEVLQIMAEELRQPLFDAAEFDKAKAQYQAALQRSLENTAAQAVAALSRQIYDTAHPNYLPPTRQSVARLDALTVEQVRAYHARHFGARDLLLVFVGDLDPDAIEKAVRDAFGDWPAQETPPAYAITTEPREPGQNRVLMPGKMNLDVRMGHALPVRRQDEDYLPLYLANYVLGG
ncbi:MAG: M16 family metallopeptidase, partial [Rhodothermales bacterium]